MLIPKSLVAARHLKTGIEFPYDRSILILIELWASDTGHDWCSRVRDAAQLTSSRVH